MKLALAVVALVVLVLLLFALSRFGNGTDQDQSSASAQTQQPAAKPSKPASPALSVMPSTSVISGKPVRLDRLPGGLAYYDTKVGTGASPKNGQLVTVKYTGTLLDGTLFDSTAKDGGKPFNFTIGTGQVIKGWDEGVLSMKVGGERRLVIPASLGYGPGGQGPIPPNATLVFDIDLLAIK